MVNVTNFWVNPDPKESPEKRVARFKQWFNRSRVGHIVKGGRYRTGKLSKRQSRDSALMREKYRAERERKKYYQ